VKLLTITVYIFFSKYTRHLAWYKYIIKSCGVHFKPDTAPINTIVLEIVYNIIDTRLYIQDQSITWRVFENT